ncbi:MAG: hypothetical protein Q3971_03520 [Moraxella sp.]|nr:hypothetical protein [Moraxella sp.]
MLFNTISKIKVVKLPSKLGYIRVVHGSYVNSIDISYQDYESLSELRAVLQGMFNYLGIEVTIYFGGSHFVVFIDDEEVLKVADIVCVADDD